VETASSAIVESAQAPIGVSLVIPMFNEKRSLPALFDSIARQTLAPDEIVLVDAGSTDGTLDVAARLAAEDHRIRIVKTERATPGRGRNLGIASARHDWTALTDAGILLDPRWLEQLVEALKADPGAEVVYGNFEPLTRTFFERCAALSYPPPKVLRPGGYMRGPSIASALIRRKVWQAVGGFPDLRAAEDLIFIEKIREQGFKTAWAPQATVWWELQPTLKRTFGKFVLYSRHNVWIGRQWDWHYGVARKYIFGLFFLILALIHSWWWLLLPLAGAAARVAKSIWDRREGRGPVWLLNPFQFIGVAVILLTIDMAAFWGWAQALRQQPEQSNSTPSTLQS
jgi:glycosyltransferase involved in cell wall biosynthesis